MNHDELRKLAEAASHDGHIYTHPRDSNHWQANQAWHKAASPAVVVRLLDELNAIGAGRSERLRSVEVCAVCGDGQAHLVRFCETCGSEYVGVAETRRAQAVAHPVHQDDAAADALVAAMKAKLAKQRAKGYGGWDTPECTQQRLSDMLRTHVNKGDPVDVANFCAFLAARGEGIAALPTPKAEPTRQKLRDLVDAVWNKATQSTQVPSTKIADALIDQMFAEVEAQPAVEPVAWREQFASQVYADLAAADNQDVPLEEYPARILKVLDSIVGPRHPTVVQWRNDAIKACIEIVKRYGGGTTAYQERDMAALLGTAPAPNALDAISQAIRDYHFALDSRQHGGVAADAALRAIQSALSMIWQQGTEAARRAAQSAQGVV